MQSFEVSSRDNVADAYERNLPPVDGGKEAWLFLAACFIIEALIWGRLSTLLYLGQDHFNQSTQALPSLMVFFRITIAPMSHSKALVTSPSWALAPW